jgi:hypothetical protein
MSNIIDPSDLGLSAEYRDLILVSSEDAGDLYDAIMVAEGKRQRVLIRTLNFEIKSEELEELKNGLSADDFLLDFFLAAPRVMVTRISHSDRLSDFNRTDDPNVLLCLSEYEAIGIGYRVLKIIQKLEPLGLFVFNIHPGNLYVSPIPGVHIRDRVSTHHLKIAEPYLHFFYDQKLGSHRKDVYIPPNFEESNDCLLSWSLGCLLYNLTNGERWDNQTRENSNLSYVFARVIFELLKERARDRLPLSDAERRLRNLSHFDRLVIYPFSTVVNMLTQKGIYKGQMKYGMIHGKGVFIRNKQYCFSNEVEKYDGYYCFEKMHIRGTISYKSGDVYSGEISYDIPKGRGTFTKHGVVMKGYWENLSLTDDEAAEIIYSDGSVYKGFTYKNMPNGRGVLTQKDGSVYSGMFENGLKHGLGKLVLTSDQDVLYSYEGHWYQDEKKGENCREFVKDTYEYVGSFNLGKMHGQGKLTDFKNKFVYEGEFMWGKYHGSGSIEFFDNEDVPFLRYKGMFNAGMKEGYGICEYADGSAYDGEWKADKRHGEGILVDSSGNESSVRYDEGELISQEDFSSN